jgi:hypothetical protein
MHGPYSVEITAGRETVVFDENDLAPYVETADRFYQGNAVGIAVGALRCGVFAAADLLAPGEDGRVEVFGYDGSGKNAKRQAWQYADARREPDGRFVTTLGSRFGERVFVGV